MASIDAGVALYLLLVVVLPCLNPAPFEGPWWGEKLLARVSANWINLPDTLWENSRIGFALWCVWFPPALILALPVVLFSFALTMFEVIQIP